MRTGAGVPIFGAMPTWTEVVLRASGHRGCRPAVTDVRTGDVLTYDMLAKQVGHAAAALRARGLVPGEPVIVHLPPGHDYPLAVHAVTAAGALVVPLAADMDRDAFYERLSSSRARMMITDAALAERAAAAVGDSRIRRILTFAEVAETVCPDGVDDPVPPGPDAPALTFDGRRALSHAHVVAELGRLVPEAMIRERDFVLVGTCEPREQAAVFDLALMGGAHVVAAPGATAGECRRLIEEYGITVAAVPQGMVREPAESQWLRVPVSVYGHTMDLVMPRR